MSSSFILTAYAAFALLLLGFSTETMKLAHGSIKLFDAYEIRTALELYDNEHGVYPRALADLEPMYLEAPEGKDLTAFKYSQLAGGASYSLAIRNK